MAMAEKEDMVNRSGKRGGSVVFVELSGKNAKKLIGEIKHGFYEFENEELVLLHLEQLAGKEAYRKGWGETGDRYFQRAAERLDDPVSIASTRLLKGDVTRKNGFPGRALRSYETATEILEAHVKETGDYPFGELLHAYTGMAAVLFDIGNPEAAKRTVGLVCERYGFVFHEDDETNICLLEGRLPDSWLHRPSQPASVSISLADIPAEVVAAWKHNSEQPGRLFKSHLTHSQ